LDLLFEVEDAGEGALASSSSPVVFAPAVAVTALERAPSFLRALRRRGAEAAAEEDGSSPLDGISITTESSSESVERREAAEGVDDGGTDALIARVLK
jgi:hypothetical protein